MERGELWWAQLDIRRPVVVLSCDPGREDVQVMQIVPPATPADRQGFLVLSGEQAVDAGIRNRMVAEAGPVRAVGIEVWFGAAEGLADDGVVRVAFPQDGVIFCTWGMSLSKNSLIERISVCSAKKLHELDVTMKLIQEGHRSVNTSTDPFGVHSRSEDA